MSLLADIFLIAFAGLYLWVLASQLHTPVIRPVQRWLRRGWRRPLLSCPWCSGFWLAVVLALTLHAITGRLHWLLTPLVILAAAALIGLVGSMWTPGIEDPEEDEPDISDGEYGPRTLAAARDAVGVTYVTNIHNAAAVDAVDDRLRES